MEYSTVSASYRTYCTVLLYIKRWRRCTCTNTLTKTALSGGYTQDFSLLGYHLFQFQGINTLLAYVSDNDNI